MDEILRQNREMLINRPELFVQQRTVQLYQETSDGDLVIDESGCVVEYCGRKYVFTMLHGVSESMKLLVRDKSNQTCLQHVGKYPIVANTKLSNCPDRGDPIVDFTFFPILDNVVPARVYVKEDTYEEESLEVFPSDITTIEELDARDEYFCGGGIPIPDDVLDRYRFNFIQGLKFARYDNDYIYFDVPEAMSVGDLDLGGMSGAPIFDGNGVPIALLGGCFDSSGKNQLWGLNINSAIRIFGQTIEKKMSDMHHLEEDIKIKIIADAKKSYFAQAIEGMV